MREQFHRMSAEVPALFQVAGLWVVLQGALVGLSAIHTLRHWHPLVSRVALWLAFGVTMSVLLSSQWARVAIGWPEWAAIAIGSILTVAAVGLSWRLAPSTHSRLSWALAIGCGLFVASQPLFVSARAPHLLWPAWPKPPALTDGAKPLQVFLLLDELNADASGPIVEALMRNGLTVTMRPIDAVGDGTAKAIPAMFSGGNFEHAKPCGPVSTCGSADVLDFSKVAARRDDIDVVGFYMPYCAIAGLRYCARTAIDVPLLDWRLWGCAAFRRLDHFPGAMTQVCALMHRQMWERLTDDVEAALWRAPVWDRGGFLFAHVPLPHPPGAGAPASLASDYAANVGRSVDLVGRIVRKARAGRIGPLSLVIFSDHPLRTRRWCRDPMYSGHPCRSGDALEDSKVPLIVAGDPVPDTARVVSNRTIFSLEPVAR